MGKNGCGIDVRMSGRRGLSAVCLLLTDDYAEVREHHHRSSLSQFGTTILPNDVIVGERIGEGQFGDVHKGLLFPQVSSSKHRKPGWLYTCFFL